jgi:hypothetical protein
MRGLACPAQERLLGCFFSHKICKELKWKSARLMNHFELLTTVIKKGFITLP